MHYQIVFSGKNLDFGTEQLSKTSPLLEKESLGIHFSIGLIRNIKFVGEGERDFCLTHHFLTGIISGKWALTYEKATIHYTDSAGPQRPDTLKHFSEASPIKDSMVGTSPRSSSNSWMGSLWSGAMASW